jgi:hypothetical protein
MVWAEDAHLTDGESYNINKVDKLTPRIGVLVERFMIKARATS